ncbi:lysine--tRNA ligase [Christensenellaceae bacterium OttesenSCG-928-K19]|nr:lysine--tRNA ligase [Christensenellaceae bacterium OttesenSCG-928-K19]
MPEREEQTQELSEILRVRRDKLEALKQEGRDPYEVTSFDKTHGSTDIIDRFDEYEGKDVSVAGRIISKRIMGKASFFHILDGQGSIQVYARRDVMGEEPYAEYKKMDIGDIVGVTGEAFRTNAGEISVKAHTISLLSKSLLPLPEKWHGLKDTDLRYRQRYVDLIVNPDVKKTFYMRSKIIKSIRDFMDNRGYIEVETPILQDSAGGAAARPFITHHNTLDMDMYMRIATELHLKRLIVGGFEKVYEIGRIFRNEGMDTRHNPEFTTIEMYEAYTDYKGMMDLCEDLICYCAEQVLESDVLTYDGVEVNLKRPWKRLTMVDAVKEYAGVDFSACEDDEQARSKAKEAGIHFEGTPTRGELLNEAFEQKVEEHLVQPTFICDYPVEVSPLAKRKADEPWLTERFEVFVTSRELGNAFSELNDPDDQRERFMDQVRRREEGDDEANMMDEDFVTALSYAMPPTGGMGIGIDRLVMLLTDSHSIRDVLLFPTMKPKGE